MVKSKVGPPVTGPDFFDRERELRQYWEHLHGEDLLLLAPRRVGKTSLMLRLQDTAGERGVEARYLSVAGAEDEADFVKKLYATLPELPSGPGVLNQLRKGPLGSFFKRIKKVEAFKVSLELERLDAPEEDRWALLGGALAEALDGRDGRSILLVDELPIFVLSLVRQDPSGRRARRFLSWFRELRQHPDRMGRLRWFLAGSIGLDTVAARYNLGDTINDLYLVHLGAFDTETADRLLQELGRTYELPLGEKVREHILQRIGWLIPYHVQLLFSELRAHCADRGVEPSRKAVDAVFDQLLSPSKKLYFDYWRQRLDEELGRPDSGFALKILNAVAQDPRGMKRKALSPVVGEEVKDPDARDERLRYLLDVLVSDGYLVEQQGRYTFRSPLLREFWLRRIVP